MSQAAGRNPQAAKMLSAAIYTTICADQHKLAGGWRCAEHEQWLEGESPLHNLMGVKCK